MPSKDESKGLSKSWLDESGRLQSDLYAQMATSMRNSAAVFFATRDGWNEDFIPGDPELRQFAGEIIAAAYKVYKVRERLNPNADSFWGQSSMTRRMSSHFPSFQTIPRKP